MPEHPIAAWHQLVRSRNPGGLDALLDEDAVFVSRVVHGPRRGKRLAVAYLTAAFHVFPIKVIIRPLKAINLVHQRMAAMLQANQ